jgi:hypothetical protein
MIASWVDSYFVGRVFFEICFQNLTNQVILAGVSELLLAELFLKKK